MNQRCRTSPGALVVAVTVVLASASACTPTVPPTAGPPLSTPAPSGSPTRTSTAPPRPLVTEQAVSTVVNTDGGYADVHGDRIVYDERVNLDSDFDVWLFEATTGRRRRISTSALNDRYPKIYGDYVVYARNYEGVYLYQISTGRTRTVVSHNAQSQFVDIYGDKVAYSRYNRASHSLDGYVYDIPTGRETLIASGRRADGRSVDDRVQSIWGDNVVYVSAYQDLRVVNVVTKHSFSLHAAGFAVDLDSSDARRSRPAIAGNTVVYVAKVSGIDQVFTYDLSSGRRTQVTTEPTPHANPAIDGSRVVFETGKIDDPELVLYDVAEGQLLPVGVGKAMQPALWGDRLAWSDLRSATLNGDPMDEGANWGNEDVYTGVFTSPATPAVPSGTP